MTVARRFPYHFLKKGQDSASLERAYEERSGWMVAGRIPMADVTARDAAAN